MHIFAAKYVIIFDICKKFNYFFCFAINIYGSDVLLF